MKIKELINEDDKYEYEDYETDENIESDIESILYIIESDCQQYIKENPNHKETILYRGYDDIHENYDVINIRQNRTPTSSSRELTKYANNLFAKAGFKANRTNSIFCSGSFSQIKQYGEPCVIYPLDGYSYLWSDKIVDMYTQRDKFIRRTRPSNIKELYHKFPNEAEEALPEEMFSAMEENKLSDENYFRYFDELIYYMRRNHMENWYQYLKIDQNSVNAIKTFYHDDNLVEGIESDHEIMITGQQALYIQWHFFRDYLQDRL